MDTELLNNKFNVGDVLYIKYDEHFNFIKNKNYTRKIRVINVAPMGNRSFFYKYEPINFQPSTHIMWESEEFLESVEKNLNITNKINRWRE